MDMLRLNAGYRNTLITAVVLIVGTVHPRSYAQESINDAVQKELTIIENGISGVTVIYTPDITSRMHTIEGTTFTSFELASGTFETNPGEPVIPRRQVLIAIPDNSSPVIDLVEEEYFSRSNVVPVRVPGSAVTDIISSVNRWIPGESFTTNGTAYIRLQRVLPVTLNPIRYNPALREARIASRIVLNVSFNTPGTAAQTAGVRTVDPVFEQTYRNILVNYNAGKSWRRVSAPKQIRKQSQLPDGLLYTIPVSTEGIYRITYQDLVQSGISPENIDPRTIKIYNNNGRILPEPINNPRPEGLVENAIRVVGEEDGSFDTTDYILFYGRGTEGWEWNTSVREIRHYQSVYARENLYWFSFGGAPGKRMETVPFTQEGTGPVESARALVYQEDEKEKLHSSGNNWYMDILFKNDTKLFETTLTGYKPGSEAEVRILVTTASIFQHQVTTTVNNGVPEIISFSNFADRLIRINTPAEDNGAVRLEISNTSPPKSLSQIYLDWFEIEYERELRAVDGTLKFHTPDPAEFNGTVQFLVSGFAGDRLDIYNVSDFDNVRMHEFSFNQSESTALFSETLGVDPQQFLVVDRQQYLSVPDMEPQSFNDLRVTGNVADMLIVTPREFVGPARRLGEFRESHDNFRTEVVTVEDIYDNFSGGLQDPVAIRDFVKFAFEQWRDQSNNPLQYLLLFGDGNYDYLSIRNTSADIKVPPFQVNSVFDLTTRTIDDFYGFVSGDDRFLDIAIGRLPVQSVSMAQGVVDKIISYQMNPFFGPWRNRIGFAADDEVTPTSFLERLHTDQTELIARAPYIPPYLNQRKIYLMEFPGVRDVTTSSVRKPDAQDTMVALMNEGVHILNYIGHGNERVLAHELVLNREVDMERIDNGRKQFFFYLSSCTFGRWDIPDEDSMGELLVTQPDRGAIALVSAARDVFAGPNHALMEAFYQNFFNGTRKTAPFGVAMIQAKLLNRSINSEKYHLLGDPSMYLELPGDIVEITSVQPDSLKALATVQVNGAIATPGPFDGSVFLSVFDTEKDGEHIMQNGNPVNYKLPGSSIFRGTLQLESVSGNQFSMGFIVPKDITYGGTDGRVSVYVWNNEKDGAVVIGELPVGGTQVGVIDNDGPEIEVMFDGRQFVSGDLVNSDPELQVRLSDPHGINITGEVGHKIELTLDNDPNIVDLSKFFEYDNGSFTTGSARYRITGLPPGEHTVTLRAWDNFNNSTTFKGILAVIAEDDLFVQDVYNYPNPFTEETQFTFQINSPVEAEIEVKIFTVAGRLVKTIHYFHDGSSSFFASPPWDGTDEDGDRLANGTYLYKLIASANSGGTLKQVEKISKLVIMR